MLACIQSRVPHHTPTSPAPSFANNPQPLFSLSPSCGSRGLCRARHDRPGEGSAPYRGASCPGCVTTIGASRSGKWQLFAAAAAPRAPPSRTCQVCGVKGQQSSAWRREARVKRQEASAHCDKAESCVADQHHSASVNIIVPLSARNKQKASSV